MTRANKKLHSKTGWRYERVNKIIEGIHEIFDKEKVTFVEEYVILGWFHTEMIYNMSKWGAKDFVEEHLKMPENPNIRNPSYIG